MRLIFHSQFSIVLMRTSGFLSRGFVSRQGRAHSYICSTYLKRGHRLASNTQVNKTDVHEVETKRQKCRICSAA